MSDNKELPDRDFFILKGLLIIIMLCIMYVVADAPKYLPVPPGNVWKSYMIIGIGGAFICYFYTEVVYSFIGLIMVFFSLINLVNILYSSDDLFAGWLVMTTTVVVLVALSIYRPRYFENSWMGALMSVVVSLLLYFLLTIGVGMESTKFSAKEIFVCSGLLGFQFGEVHKHNRVLDAVVDSVASTWFHVFPSKHKKSRK